MLPVGLIIYTVLLMLSAPTPVSISFVLAWVALWIIWNWLKVWAVKRTESQ